MNIEEELLTELSYFGLDKTDATMYLGLLRIGSLTVGKMSTKLEIDRGKAYRSLNKLRDMGLITTTFSNPTICEAVSPEDALTSVIQRKEDEITTMQKLSRKIVADLKNLNRPQQVSEISSISIIQGRSNIYSRIGKLKSKRRVIVEEGGQLIMSGSIKETMDLNDDNDSILVTNSQEMINNMFSLCSHLWKKAKPVDKILA